MEVERLWSLGVGGWWDLPDAERVRLLGWYWVHSGQIEAAARKTKGKAPKPHKVVRGAGLAVNRRVRR